MAETGSKAPASKTLNYELDANVMTQIRTAGLEEAKADAMKGPEGQLFSAKSVTGYLNTAIAGIDAWKRGKAKGEEETAKLMDAFQQANLTEGWTTSELRATWIEGEKARQTDYQNAVRSGDRQKQQDILAEQEKETQQLGKFDVVGKALIATIDDAGLMDDADAFPPRDRTFLTGYVDPRNLEVIKDEETGNMLMGVEYETTFDDTTNNTLGNFRDQDELVNLLNDPNSGYRLVSDDGARIEPPLSADNLVEGNRVVRALNSEQITDIVGNSTNPTVEALEIEKQIQRMEKEKSKVGLDVDDKTNAQYNFNPTSVSSGFGAMVNNGNAKKLMYGDLDQNSTFAQDFLLHPDFSNLGPEFNVNGVIPIPDGADQELINANTDGEPGLSAAEIKAAFATTGFNKRLVLKELEKPENINILKEYWGEWMMLKTRARLFGVGPEAQDVTLGEGIKFGGASGVAQVQGGGSAVTGGGYTGQYVEN